MCQMGSIIAVALHSALGRHLQGVDGNLHLVHLQTQNIKLNITITIFFIISNNINQLINNIYY